MNLLDCIFNRHSYRGRYRGTPVPREDLAKIMQAGLAAPSGCNKQTTSLIAVDDPAVLARLHAVIDPPVGETAPAAICVLTRRIAAYRDKCYAVQDYSAAIENMLLAITALGYHVSVGIERLQKIILVLFEKFDLENYKAFEESIITHSHVELNGRICSLTGATTNKRQNDFLQVLTVFYKSERYYNLT